ncbi:hypothetical protein Tco_0538307 [Tanacetum coccineum]
MEMPGPFVNEVSYEEDEDTLSLSDLSMYYDHKVEYQTEKPSATDGDDQDFEFSSEMMIKSHDSLNPIVFCGKIIRYSPHSTQKPGTIVQRKVSIFGSKKKSIRWYFYMFGFGSSRFTEDLHIEDLRKRRTFIPSKCNDRGMGKSRCFVRPMRCTWVVSNCSLATILVSTGLRR